MTAPTPLANITRYGCICADPPWAHPRRVPQTDAARRYPLMATADVCELPVRELADPAGCHLWLWAINSMLEDAYTVCRAWGFQPINLLTWCKSGPPGVGSYLRTNTEQCILATQGPARPPATKPMASWFDWPEPAADGLAALWPRGRHSEKPDAFYDLAEQVSPGPRLELFARRARFGWEYAGDQSLSTATVGGLAA